MILSTFIGRLGKDAEQRTSKNGETFLTYTLATDDFVNGAKTTTWVNITDFSRKSTSMLPYLKTGTQVLVNGTLSVRTYQGKDGSNQFSIDVMADRVTFASGGKSSATTQESSATQTEQQTPNVQRATNSVEIPVDCGTLHRPQQAATVATTPSTDVDDLPF